VPLSVYASKAYLGISATKWWIQLQLARSLTIVVKLEFKRFLSVIHVFICTRVVKQKIENIKEYMFQDKLYRIEINLDILVGFLG